MDTSQLKPQLKELEQVKTTHRLTPAGDLKPVPQNHTQVVALNAYVELLKLKNYSANTIKNYKNNFIIFLNHFADRKPSTISKYEIMDFLVAQRKKESWSSTTQNQMINSINPVGLKN